MTNREIRDQEVTILLQNSCFTRWLQASLDWRWRWRMSVHAPLSPSELEDEIRVALTMGYNLAVMFRFLESMQLTHWDEEAEWWDESWLKAMRAAKLFPPSSDQSALRGRAHRMEDYVQVLKMFPELGEYYPDTEAGEEGVSIEEVLECARRELYDLVFGPGTPYLESRFLSNERRSTRHAISDRYLEMLSHGPGTRILLPDGSADYPDCSDHGENNVPGPSPALITVGTHLIEVYGPRPTAYWLWEKMYYPRKYTRLISVLGGENAPVWDTPEYHALKRDVSRKIPGMDSELPALAQNPELQDAFRELVL